MSQGKIFAPHFLQPTFYRPLKMYVCFTTIVNFLGDVKLNCDVTRSNRFIGALFVSWVTVMALFYLIQTN